MADLAATLVTTGDTGHPVGPFPTRGAKAGDAKSDCYYNDGGDYFITPDVDGHAGPGCWKLYKKTATTKGKGKGWRRLDTLWPGRPADGPGLVVSDSVRRVPARPHLRRARSRILMAATPRPVLLCFDGSPDAAAAIHAAGRLMSGREAIVLSVAIPAEAGFPLEPLGEIVGRLSSVYRDWDEIAAEVAERQARAGCALAVDAGLRSAADDGGRQAGRDDPPRRRRAGRRGDRARPLPRHGALDGLLGGVAIRVVQQADRPVVLIPRVPVP